MWATEMKLAGVAVSSAADSIERPATTCGTGLFGSTNCADSELRSDDRDGRTGEAT